jgi:hypothetical protein
VRAARRKYLIPRLLSEASAAERVSSIEETTTVVVGTGRDHAKSA